MTEKLSPIARALRVASGLEDTQAARRIVMLICESGMKLDEPVHNEPTEGEKHYAKREKFIKRMKSSTDRVLNYAKHETLRNIEKHFRDNPEISAAEGDAPEAQSSSLSARLTFDKDIFAPELLAALREDQESALNTAGQQLYDEIGKDSVWTTPSKDAIQFVQDRANLLANVPDEVHSEIMQSIEQGLQDGESRKELMARIGAAFDEIGRGRAETIANTETAAAFNYARDKAMREAGVTHKKWLHSQSPLIKEPRPTHLEADGQVQPIDDPFDVGGVQFMRPADDSLGAGPEDIINCHCVAIPVEAPIKSSEADCEWITTRGRHVCIRKGQSVKDALREQEGGHTVKPPKKLYRGVTEEEGGTHGYGTHALGKGIYTSRDKSFAKKYGNKVIEVDVASAFPKRPLVISNAAGGGPQAFSDWVLRNSDYKNIREFNKAYPDPSHFVKSKGYDGVIVGDEIVKYDS